MSRWECQDKLGVGVLWVLGGVQVPWGRGGLVSVVRVWMSC